MLASEPANALRAAMEKAIFDINVNLDVSVKNKMQEYNGGDPDGGCAAV
jgi:hypothetical protein